MPVDLIVTAERLEYADGVLTATGAVRVVYGDQVLTGATASLTEDVLVIETGVYVRPDGTLSFDRAEVHLRAQSASLDHALVTPCACPDGGPPALRFSAREALLVDEVVVIHGGAVRVFDAPLLPIPYGRVPLNADRFRVLFPELSHGSFGWAAAVAGRWRSGDHQFTVGPAWRQDRGIRAEAEVVGPDGAAQLAVGPDALAEQWRGALVSRGGRAAPLRVGWDLALYSDPAWPTDFATDYVSRGLPYQESRAVVGYGPARLSSAWADDGSDLPVAAAVLRPVLAEGAAGQVMPRVGAAVVGERAQGIVGVDAQAQALPGPLRVWGRGSGDGWYAAEGVGAEGRAEARVEVPFWSAAGAWRAQWWPGLQATGDLDSAAAASWWAGPSLSVEAVGPTISLQADVRVPIPEAIPTLWLSAGAGPAELRGQLDPDQQAAALRWRGGPELTMGVVHTDALWVLTQAAMVGVGRLRIGDSVGYDPLTGALTELVGRIGYDDGCSSLTLSAAYSADRNADGYVLPEMGLSLVLRK